MSDLLHCSGPYTEVKCSAETSVDFQQTTGRCTCISEDITLQDRVLALSVLTPKEFAKDVKLLTFI
jgi:hypothetical protein